MAYQRQARNLDISTTLRERRDHFVITIYKEQRKKYEVNVGDFLVFKLNNKLLIRPIRRDYHVSLPKKLLRDKCHGEKIIIRDVLIFSPEICSWRPSVQFENSILDIRSIVPLETRKGYPLRIFPLSFDKSIVWFSVPGGVEPIVINNFINLEDISEMSGFYFGDGTTCEGIQTFVLTNSEPSTIKHAIKFLRKVGISKGNFRFQIIYSNNHIFLSDKVKRRCIDFWVKELEILESQVVSVNLSRSKKEGVRHGSIKLLYYRVTFVEIMLNFLREIENILRSNKFVKNKEILKGFMRGLLAAEGCPESNQIGSLIKVGISFDPYSKELEIYRKLLGMLDISYGKASGNCLYVYGHDNFKKFYTNKFFGLHKKRNLLFYAYYKNHAKTKLLR